MPLFFCRKVKIKGSRHKVPTENRSVSAGRGQQQGIQPTETNQYDGNHISCSPSSSIPKNWYMRHVDTHEGSSAVHGNAMSAKGLLKMSNK